MTSQCQIFWHVRSFAPTTTHERIWNHNSVWCRMNLWTLSKCLFTSHPIYLLVVYHDYMIIIHICLSTFFVSHMGFSKNRGGPPQIINSNRVFPYFHQPFWDSPIFGNCAFSLLFQAVETRNFTGTQLIDRNDELCILWEKANIQVGSFFGGFFGWFLDFWEMIQVYVGWWGFLLGWFWIRGFAWSTKKRWLRWSRFFWFFGIRGGRFFFWIRNFWVGIF